jgi:hypothetical protein
LSDSERATVLGAIRPGNGDVLAARLSEGARKNVVRALRRLASASNTSTGSAARGAPERRPQAADSDQKPNPRRGKPKARPK